MWGSVPEHWNHDPSWRQMRNPLSHAGTLKWPLIVSFNADVQRFCGLKVAEFAQSWKFPWPSYLTLFLTVLSTDRCSSRRRGPITDSCSPLPPSSTINQPIWSGHLLINPPYFFSFSHSKKFSMPLRVFEVFLVFLDSSSGLVQGRITSSILLGWKLQRLKCNASIPIWNPEGQEFHSWCTLSTSLPCIIGAHRFINSFKDMACVLFIFVSFLVPGTMFCSVKGW